MTEMAPSGSKKDGNTKRPSPAKRWCFTWNNPPRDGVEQLKMKFGSNGSSKWVFQLEVGDSGTEHFQGYIVFEKKCRPIEKIKIKEIHWEPCRGDELSNIKYCSKEPRIKGPWLSNIRIPKPLKIVDKLLPWQEKVWNIVNGEPDDRTINWFYETDGCVGKTALCKYICSKIERSAFVSGKAADIKFAVSTALKKYNNELDVVIFHFVRSQEEYVSYQAIEEVKDGMFFSAKYESCMELFNSPHIVIFANFYPDTEKLSLDRWNIVEIE